MGRKAIDKERKALTKKIKLWLRELVPLLQDKELNNFTLDELAELGGKSKSNIYTYFSSKEEIYKAVVQSIVDEMDFVISKEAIQGDDVEQNYRTLLIRLCEGIQDLSINFIEQMQLYFPDAWDIIEEFSMKVLSNLEALYKKGMESGVFKTFNISLLTELDRHFVLSIMTNATRFTNQGLTFRGVISEYLELRLNALKH
ncbi:TetR/AcrR family transcriptional regulator [Flavobacterium sp. CS20]|uniref:TetR/AcrR family transcriptional regulator n=1 Tax=Flavobacterium sp. CS20 TaxID=2775246 RepID=UPI001B39D1F3|nr:TetR/AcrR family transcriptional regulator [Flavobacterium sp. CS20]QTY27295.1 TetR/AcrR family transcriptional regulator [Flavobacterium sp. CS20]